MKYVKTFWMAFWSGLAAPGLLFATPNYPRIPLPETTNQAALRGDWERIGEDFNRVILREQEHPAA
jgi:hypothetical protein